MHLTVLIATALLSLTTATQIPPYRPCGIKAIPCPPDQVCRPTSTACTDLHRCQGACQFRNTYPTCGGYSKTPKKCSEGSTCKDDPRVAHNFGMACDFPGMCVPDDVRSCRGVGGLRCPEGLHCYDFPEDGCDHEKGEADCLGICL